MGQAQIRSGLDRRFRELRPHLPERSLALDDLCAVAVAATGGRDAAVTICDGERHVVLGGCNFDLAAFPRLFPEDLSEAFFEGEHLEAVPAFTAYADKAGRDPVRSFLMTPIRIDGQPVGILAVDSDIPEGAFSPLDRALLFRLAQVAEGLIRSEVSLSRVVNQALATIAESSQ
jgi:GAF domain-containing protein